MFGLRRNDDSVRCQVPFEYIHSREPSHYKQKLILVGVHAGTKEHTHTHKAHTKDRGKRWNWYSWNKSTANSCLEELNSVCLSVSVFLPFFPFVLRFVDIGRDRLTT